MSPSQSNVKYHLYSNVIRIDSDIIVVAMQVGQEGENKGARDFSRWVTDNVNPTLVDASRQNAKKVKLKLGPDNKVCAIITETHQEQADQRGEGR